MNLFTKQNHRVKNKLMGGGEGKLGNGMGWGEKR